MRTRGITVKHFLAAQAADSDLLKAAHQLLYKSQGKVSAVAWPAPSRRACPRGVTIVGVTRVCGSHTRGRRLPANVSQKHNRKKNLRAFNGFAVRAHMRHRVLLLLR